MSNVPKFDSRDFSSLMEEIKILARQYTPEWNFDENSDDFGIVLSKIYSKMMENTISKYNKMSYNYYLTFLNIIGTKLKSAAPSEGIVTVNVINNSKGEYIEKGSAIYADADTEDGRVIYETKDALTAVSTAISKVYFTNSDSDFIGCVYERDEDEDDENKIKVGSFRIFDDIYYKNLQCHELYIGDSTVFDMSNTDVTFSFYNSMSAKSQKMLPKIFSDKNNAQWQYYDGKLWVPVKETEETENGVRIKFDGKTDITSVMDKESRYLRCKFNTIPEDGIALTSIGYKTKSSELVPENLFSGDEQQPLEDFFPFGERYSLYNDFSIICDEAISKKGANIEISFDMQFVKIATDATMPMKNYKIIMTDIDFADLDPKDIKIQKVRWEYWNGNGWSMLTNVKEDEEFFNPGKEVTRTIKFKSPKDIEKISVGSAEGGYVIRARISKMKDQFDFYSNYITPYVHKVRVNYYYDDYAHEVQDLIVNTDMKMKQLQLSDDVIKNVMQRNLCNYPAMYLQLEKPLVQGVIRILVDIEEGVHRYNPVLKWEYLADDHKGGKIWKHIDVVDETENFSHTGTVTLIGRNDFIKSNLFDKEGYFIRIINPDKRYSRERNMSSRPVIQDIKFNAVRIVQKETKEPEYFSIEKGEKNKTCFLSSNDASDAIVWVDEFGSISTVEQERFLKMPTDKVLPEYDEFGKLERLWVRWKPVPNLIAHGHNERVYEVDYPRGEIRFGDGKNGRIPTSQYSESIKVEYSVCRGSLGNIDANAIKDFIQTKMDVDKVVNSTPIMGGVDMETIDGAARRMFSQISGGNRMVSLNDFEDSICFNDRNIYKVKCLPHVNEDSKDEIGVTSIAVLPRKIMQGYEKFQGIKDKIWKFIDEKSHATLATSTKLRVFEVSYVETSIHVDVAIKDFNSYQDVYNGIEKKLKEFLHPVTGNFSHQGWNIGDFPRKELIYNFIKSVPGIKWIKDINIFTYLVTSEGKKEIDYERIDEQKFAVPVYGEPEINITV